MARNRTIYQTENVYAGPCPATGKQSTIIVGTPAATAIKQLERVQSANYGYTRTRQDVNQFGELAAIDRVSLESPTVNLDITWLSKDFYNEQAVGFYIVTGGTSVAEHGIVWNDATRFLSSIKSLLDKTQDERNYYIKTVPEGIDEINRAADTTNQFVNIGNGFISNYTATAAVGGFPTNTLTVEGLNFVYAVSAGPVATVYPELPAGGIEADVVENPAVYSVDGRTIKDYIATFNLNPGYTGWITGLVPTGASTLATGYAGGSQLHGIQTTVLKPGDIFFNFVLNGEDPKTATTTSLGLSLTDMKIQSYNLSFALAREPLQKLGSKYAFSREVTYPVQVTCSIDATVGDIGAKNLATIITEDKNYDVYIWLRHPTGSWNQMCYALKNCKLDSQNITSSIGPAKAVTLNFVGQIGGPGQTDRGLFMSGVRTWA